VTTALQTYRPDIDGLRAVAVLCVLAYHAAPQALPGGFIGVDIFFVISGYLITGIIASDLARARFTLAGFYARRIRRIFPALALVLAATLAYGALVLLPQEFSLLGRDTAAGAAFVANLAFWSEVGYFDRDAATKPLLHLWSLGVEEQFYILWPLLLAALHRGGAIRLWPLAALAALSLALCLGLAGTASAFYSPFTRLWELAAGALLALALRQGWNPPRPAALSLAGLALILAPLALLNHHMPFPGWRAIPPVLGTVLLIAAGPAAPANRALAWRPAVAIGLISYPLYLWHWPLLAYAHVIHQGRPLKPLLVAALVAVAIALAWATWRFVERPIRHGPHARIPALSVAMAALALAGLAAWQTPAQSTLDIAAINAAIGDGVFKPTQGMRIRDVAGKLEAAIGPDNHQPGTLLVGDSLLFHYGPRAQTLANEGRLTHPVYFVTGPSCAPFPGTLRPAPFAHCRDLAAMVRDLMAREPIHTVILGAFWPGHFNPPAQVEIDGQATPLTTPEAQSAAYAHLEAEITRLRALGLRVVLLLTPPVHPGFDPRQMATRTWRGTTLSPTAQTPIPLAELEPARAATNARLADIAARTGADLRDPLPAICGPGPLCPPTTETGTPKFADDKHLRPATAATLPFLDDLLTPQPVPR
jgi:peptidoglycan/LPS O-acetylase OafA/YrhL